MLWGSAGLGSAPNLDALEVRHPPSSTFVVCTERERSWGECSFQGAELGELDGIPEKEELPGCSGGKPLGEGHCIKPLRKSPPPPSIVQQSLDFLPLQPFILRGSPNLGQPVPVGHLGSNPTTNYSLSYWNSSIYESHEIEQEPPR